MLSVKSDYIKAIRAFYTEFGNITTFAVLISLVYESQVTFITKLIATSKSKF